MKVLGDCFVTDGAAHSVKYADFISFASSWRPMIDAPREKTARVIEEGSGKMTMARRKLDAEVQQLREENIALSRELALFGSVRSL